MTIAAAHKVEALRVELFGKVQGIGFRPALARLARQNHLRGWVRNTALGIEVHIEGKPLGVAAFLQDCRSVCPIEGRVDAIEAQPAILQSAGAFEIIDAPKGDSLGTLVPADKVSCVMCLNEVGNRTDRRYGYLLNSCSHCGPRYTILESMPYERESTCMSVFPMCTACKLEYTDPDDRRFHAQTTCCSECGPQLSNLEAAIECLTSGRIVGIKAVGGYQLLAAAMNIEAIKVLRHRKRRPNKPFAVMVANVQQARTLGCLDEGHIRSLVSSVGPIVIVPLNSSAVPRSIAMGLNSIGLMLPTTPLHALLAENVGPLIVTSANLEGEPIRYDLFKESLPREPLADLWVDHNRTIQRPVDDSVVQIVAGRQTTLRLARGLAPHPLELPQHLLKHYVLAVGGHQKVAIAVSNGAQAVLGPHLGDMETTASRRRFAQHVADWMNLYRFAPSVVVHDLHDDYFTSRWARVFAADHGIPSIGVQHHHAHIVSGMLEKGWLGSGVLGFAWDGTGQGTDGSLWGGETLLASADQFQRVGTIRPFPLLGGEMAVREPRRVAAVMLREVRLWEKQFFHPMELQYPLESLLQSQRLHPITTSAGRLFDAVAALILPEEMLGDGRAGYEGHFASLLESVCDTRANGYYALETTMDFGSNNDPVKQLDWRPMIKSIVLDQRTGTSVSTIAMRFHRTLARFVCESSRCFPDLPVVLSGGVFQNRVLVELIANEMKTQSRPLALPGCIPVNDGGLAAGQLVIASYQLENVQCA